MKPAKPARTDWIDKGRISREKGSPGLIGQWEQAAQNDIEKPIPGASWVARDAVVTRSDLSPRDHQPDSAQVDAYAEILDELPPIVVQRDTLVVIDGAHRVAAAWKALRWSIPVIEIDVTDDELADEACRANVKHGIQLTATERRKAAWDMLKRHPNWSLARVREWTGAGMRVVSDVRQELVNRKVIPEGDGFVIDLKGYKHHSGPGRKANLAGSSGKLPDETAKPPDLTGTTPDEVSGNGRRPSKRKASVSSFDPGAELPPADHDGVAASFEPCDRCTHLHGEVCLAQVAVAPGRVRECGCRHSPAKSANVTASRDRDWDLLCIADKWFEVVPELPPAAWIALLRRYPAIWSDALAALPAVRALLAAIEAEDAAIAASFALKERDPEASIA